MILVTFSHKHHTARLAPEHTQLKVPNDDATEQLRTRTLTTLYNEPPMWLADCHRDLDIAVLSA